MTLEEAIDHLERFPHDWEIHKDNFRAWKDYRPTFHCYLNTDHHYEDFEYSVEGIGDTVADAVVDAFSRWSNADVE